MRLFNFKYFRNFGISKNKTKITLPVPLETKVYVVHIDCFNGCIFQKERFNVVFRTNTATGNCGKFPCYIKNLSVREEYVTLKNIERILNCWGKTIFATPEEAEKQGNKIIEKNKEALLRAGFKL